MCFLDETGQEVFLQRLAGDRGTPAERGVNVVRYVLDLDARHTVIVAPIWRYDT